MIFFLWVNLGAGLNIRTGGLQVMNNGAVDDYWKENFSSYKSIFIDGVDNDSREFIFSEESDQNSEVVIEPEKSHMKVNVHPKYINLKQYDEGIAVVSYDCDDHFYEFVHLKVTSTTEEGNKSEKHLRYLKVCKEFKPFTWSYIIASILGIMIVLLATILEKKIQNDNNPDSEVIRSWLGNKVNIGLSLFIAFIIMFVSYNIKKPDTDILLIFLNILSGFSLWLIILKDVPLPASVSLLISLGSGLLLILVSFLVPNLILQNIQFTCISILCLKFSRYSSFLLLTMASFFIAIYSALYFESDIYPSLSSPTLLEVYQNNLPCFLTLPFSFSNRAIFNACVSICELYFPGSFIIKFRNSNLSQDNFYFSLSLFVYLITTILESLLKTYLNSSSLFVAGPVMAIVLIIYSLYRKEFKKIFLESKEPGLIVKEIPMQQMK